MTHCGYREAPSVWVRCKTVLIFLPAQQTDKLLHLSGFLIDNMMTQSEALDGILLEYLARNKL